MKLKINNQIPNTEIFQLIDGEPQKSNLKEVIGNGKIVLFGLPGAFTSTCSKLHLPGFVANADKIKAKGIENIFCLSVNDPYVMNGWGEINNTGDKIKMLSDPYLSFTKSIGAEEANSLITFLLALIESDTPSLIPTFTTVSLTPDFPAFLLALLSKLETLFVTFSIILVLHNNPYDINLNHFSDKLEFFYFFLNTL